MFIFTPVNTYVQMSVLLNNICFLTPEYTRLSIICLSYSTLAFAPTSTGESLSAASNGEEVTKTSQ